MTLLTERKTERLILAVETGIAATENRDAVPQTM